MSGEVRPFHRIIAALLSYLNVSGSVNIAFIFSPLRTQWLTHFYPVTNTVDIFLPWNYRTGSTISISILGRGWLLFVDA